MVLPASHENAGNTSVNNTVSFISNANVNASTGQKDSSAVAHNNQLPQTGNDSDGIIALAGASET